MRMETTRWMAAVGAAVLIGVGAVGMAQEVDPSLGGYARSAGEVSGSLKCVGSDTMNNLVALWAEGFKKFYPSVREAVEGKGSASAPPALTEGTCTFGPMSRDMKPPEIDAFKEKHGYPPVMVPVAIVTASNGTGTASSGSSCT
jgi:phosphate transport system substrate-binding protein